MLPAGLWKVLELHYPNGTPNHEFNWICIWSVLPIWVSCSASRQSACTCSATKRSIRPCAYLNLFRSISDAAGNILSREQSSMSTDSQELHRKCHFSSVCKSCTMTLPTYLRKGKQCKCKMQSCDLCFAPPTKISRRYITKNDSWTAFKDHVFLKKATIIIFKISVIGTWFTLYSP